MTTTLTESLVDALASQYEAALSMLRSCVERVDAETGDVPVGSYPFWRVAYHVLNATDLYLSPDEAAFRPPPFHRDGYEQLGKPFWAAAEVRADQPYGRDTLVEYADICRARAKATMGAETAASLQGASGFSWLEFSRLELHLYNIRHIQHHTGQLVAALRQSRAATVDWVFA
jgi:hypothetical protein